MSIQWKRTAKGIRFLVLDDAQHTIATSAVFRNDMWARIGFLNACDLSDSLVVLSFGEQASEETTRTDHIVIMQDKTKKLYRFQYVSHTEKIYLESASFASVEETRYAMQRVHAELQRYRSLLQGIHFSLVSNASVGRRNCL